jgi:hypothetical protein
MATDSKSFPAEAVDRSTGQLLPQSEEEQKARTEALRRLFDEWPDHADDGSDSDEVWREVMRSIDEGRPHRPLFEGMY